jgi:hypothetical protein
MNVEHIRVRVKERFRPFAVVTSSGNKYPVPHPDFIFLTPRTVVIADQDGYAVLLEPLPIVGLEDISLFQKGHSGQKRKPERRGCIQ